MNIMTGTPSETTTHFIDPAENMRPAPFKHSPYKALVVPRPIGWISSISAEGVINLAPFSYFNAVCDDPPCVMYCPNGLHPDGGVKDSLKNVEETGEFVFNLSNWDLREAMNLSSEHMPRNIDEMAKVGLPAADCQYVKPPRIATAPAAFECKYVQTVKLPTGPKSPGNYLVIGEVVGIHINDDVVVDGIIDIRRMKPIARLGYMDYAVVEDFFTMERPD